SRGCEEARQRDGAIPDWVLVLSGGRGRDRTADECDSESFVSGVACVGSFGVFGWTGGTRASPGFVIELPISPHYRQVPGARELQEDQVTDNPVFREGHQLIHANGTR